MLIYEIESEAVYAIGDMHGAFEPLINWIKRNDLKNCVMICCGDIGFGFERPGHYEQIAHKFEKECSERNCVVIMLRGNHDDPSYFDGDKVDYPHFKAVPDYSIIRTCGKNILCIGGGISVDRHDRIINQRANAYKYARWHNMPLNEAEKHIERKVYWENEGVVYDDEKLNEVKKSGINIDVICSHTCPSFCEPLTKEGIKEWLLMDRELESDINEERSTMDKILERLKSDGQNIKKWVYGHFHFHYHNFDSVGGIDYVMLDMFREYQNKFDMIEIQ